MGVAALFYTMKGVAGVDTASLVTEAVGKMAEKLVSSAFEGLGNLF